ncbi:MAG: serine protease [Gemmataceae bacterium]|nr:serine protease [Gemmataceae bacterium]
MRAMRYVLFTLMLGGLALAAAPPADPWYVDDEQFNKNMTARLSKLAKKNECLRPSDLRARLKPKGCLVALTAPSDKAMTPEEVYKKAKPSVFVVGSVLRSEKERRKWEDGRQATAWALTADGVLVTNWHVLEKSGKERFGVANAAGEVFPIIDVLGGDPDADVAIIRVKGENFVPLPLGGDEPVGSWVGTLSHPGGQLFTFTQGHVTRYTREQQDGKKPAHWLSMSADYAVGSSGAPILNKYGAVIGMAAMTVTVESDADEEIPKTRRRRQDDPPMPKPEMPKDAEKLRPQVQMVTKLAVPARVIRELVCGEPAEKPGKEQP